MKTTSEMNARQRRHKTRRKAMIKAHKPVILSVRWSYNHTLFDVADQLRVKYHHGVLSACSEGVLRGATMKHSGGKTMGWVVLDSSHRAMGFSRLSGAHLADDCTGRRIEKLVVGDSSWPVGLADLPAQATILLVRGAADLIAARSFLLHAKQNTLKAPVWPVAMLADTAISKKALAVLTGRKIVLAYLADESARFAFGGWREQLEPIASEVQVIDYPRREFVDGRTPRTLLELDLAYIRDRECKEELCRLMDVARRIGREAEKKLKASVPIAPLQLLGDPAL